MENQYQKYVTISFVAFAGLIAYVIYTLTGKLVAAYDLEARIRNINLIIQIASVVIWLVGSIILYLNDQANQFMNEVVVELSRVTWPTQKDTTSATLVVIVMVLVSGLVLGLLDYLWTQVLRWVL